VLLACVVSLDRFTFCLIVPSIDRIYQTLRHCQISAEGTTGFCCLAPDNLKEAVDVSVLSTLAA
jgi:hypothetical protein